MMKTMCGVVVLCALVLCATTAKAARFDRSLKLAFDSPTGAYAIAASSCDSFNSECDSRVTVTSEAYSEAVRSVSKALADAFSQASGDGDAKAVSLAFANAVALAYAELINSYTIELKAAYGAKACGFAKSGGVATATAFSRAVAEAFAISRNDYYQAATFCIVDIVVVETQTIAQSISEDSCIENGHDYLSDTAVRGAFVETVAKAFGFVVAAIKNGNVIEADFCGASGGSTITDVSG